MNISSFLIGYQAGKNAGGGSSDDVRYVTFMSYDGSVEYGKKAVAVGDDCADPIARKIFDTPKRESTAQFHFTHDYWATEPNGATDPNALKTVTEDRVVYATFISVLRSYTITFYDGDTVLNSKDWAYGSTPSYPATKDGYDFVAWEPAVVPVTGEASYTATWKEMAKFSTATWAEIISIAQSGKAASAFALGDERTETINYADGTSESITWVIVSLNQTCPCADGSKDNITIAAKHALSEKRAMHSAKNGYYENSDLATYLNETFFNALPTDLQSGIKGVYTKSAFYDAKKVFIPHLSDLGLSKSGYEGGGNTGPFEYFDETSKRTMKQGANGSTVEYWTRSMRFSGNYGYVATVTATGEVTTNNYIYPTESYAVVPCFCI